jgi:hypothetical protein
VKNKLLLRKLCSVSAMDKVVGKLFCRGVRNYASQRKLAALFAGSKLTKTCSRQYSSTNMMKVTILGAGGDWNVLSGHFFNFFVY